MNAPAALDLSAGSRRALTIAVFMAVYMQGVNVSLPNAALANIQGALSMADDEIGWLFTSYLAGSIIVMPTTRWLAGRFGRTLIFQIAIAVFALGLVLDTLATTTMELVLARAVQGAAGGSLVPLALMTLPDVLLPAQRGKIGFGLSTCVLLGISSGASIGGWLSEYHGWHTIFYFSLPMAAYIFLVVTLLLPEKKADQKPSFDFFGFTTFSLGVLGLQMLLDRSERLEWFDSKEIWAEALASAIGFYMFFIHILTAKTHFFSKGLLRDRNFILSTIMYFAVGFVLLPTLALTSPMLNELLNYPIDSTGYMTIPRGVALIGTLVLMNFVPPPIDSRVIVIAGMAIVAYANWRMIGYSPEMDWQAVAKAGLLQGVGLGMAIPALNKTAFQTLDEKLRPEGTAIFTMTRLYGGTLGIAIVQIFFYGNTQAMHLALAKNLTSYHPSAHLAAPLAKHGLAMLNDMTTVQAAVVGILGQFKILLFVTLAVIPLVLFLRKPHPAVMLLQPAK